MNAAVPRVAGLCVVLGFLFAVPWIVDDYTVTLFSRGVSLGVLAVSVCVLTGRAGLPALGQAAPFAVGAYTTAVLANHGIDAGPVQVLASAGLAAAFGFVSGIAIVRTRATAALMVTLAIGELAVIAAGRWKSVTGGTDGLDAIPFTRPAWGMPVLEQDNAAYWYVLVVAVVAIGITWWVLRGPAGLLLDGSRDHELRMRAAGHRVTGYLLLACTGAGALAGVGGSLLVAAEHYISPDDAGFQTSALVLLAVVIGGVRSIGGAIAAAGLIVATQNWFSGPWPSHGPLLLGILFVVAVYVLPDGLAGLAGRLSAAVGLTTRWAPK